MNLQLHFNLVNLISQGQQENIGGSSFEMYAPDFSGTTRGRIGSSSFEMYAPDQWYCGGYFK